MNGIVIVWALISTCAAGTPATQCEERLLSPITYPTQVDCVNDNKDAPANSSCIEVQVLRQAAGDSSDGHNLEGLLRSLSTINEGEDYGQE